MRVGDGFAGGGRHLASWLIAAVMSLTTASERRLFAKTLAVGNKCGSEQRALMPCPGPPAGWRETLLLWQVIWAR